MPLFFIENIENQSLNEEESAHAIRVLRLKIGDSIEIFDGKGNYGDAIISHIDKKNCSFKILEKFFSQNPLSYFHLAIAPTKNSDRIEWMLEKITEIGIGTIHFIQTERTEKSRLNSERLEKKVLSAAKQSQKWHLPILKYYKSLDEFLKQTNFDIQLIAHLENGERQFIAQRIESNKTICTLIGPEGDFSPKEIELALSKSYKAVTLGNYRLRTETAGMYVSSCYSTILSK